MPWKESSVMEERLRFIARLLDGEGMSDVCRPSNRPHSGLPEVDCRFHDKDVLVTACGRVCMHRKKINISAVMAGQRLGKRQLDDGVWLVSFMHYDLGYIDLEQRTLQTIDNPFGTRSSPMSPGRIREKLVRPTGLEPATP